MKKKIAVITAVLLVAVTALFSIGIPQRLYVRVKGVKIDYNNCTVYSEKDIDLAAAVVIDKVNSFRGEIFTDRAVLYALKVYDTDCLDYCRSLNEQADYTESLAFSSVMRSPVTGGGAWNANSIYTWSWYLARTDGGEWELLTWGYA